MFAMLAAVEGKWSLMFLWLVFALIVDGIDGPLARKFDVQKNWPTYDGVLMDLIVDYLTYVFIPAYALFKSGLLTRWTGWLAIIVICYGSVIYFADTRMKTKDKSFAGFPPAGTWWFWCFCHPPGRGDHPGRGHPADAGHVHQPQVHHPTRRRRWNRLSLAVCTRLDRAGRMGAWLDFQEGPVAKWLLVLTSLYLVLAGIAQQIVPERIRRVS